MADIVTGIAYSLFIASVFLTVGSALSRPFSKRFKGQSHSEIVSFNPPGAFFAVFGRGFPWFARATLASGAALLAILAIRALV